MANSNVVELLVQRADTGETLHLKGREAWTLAHLIGAGDSGVIPLDRPAPRWSAYVHTLRKRGLDIITVDEPHAGPYSGTHGRYVLRTPLKVLKTVFAEDRRSRGFSEVVRAAYAQILGHTPDPAS
jgi:winged helix domain-containing protein